MHTEVIEPDGDLKREVWSFWLGISYGRSCIWFDGYSFQTRESLRHKKWRVQSHWSRLMQRENNMDKPNIPADVKAKVYAHYQEYIGALPID